MIWAINNQERIEASPGAHAMCPCCGGKVIAKCGDIVSWHWAHESAECDTWYEPESQWHKGWKDCFPKDWQEVVVGCHRADVKTNKLVVELQASCISSEEIEERERFYGNMVWLLRGHDFAKNIAMKNVSGDGCRTYKTFRWKWPRKSWWHAKMPIVIDMAGVLLHVKRLHHEMPCGGWGVEITEQEFIKRCYKWESH